MSSLAPGNLLRSTIRGWRCCRLPAWSACLLLIGLVAATPAAGRGPGPEKGSGGRHYGWADSAARAALTTISGRVAEVGVAPAEGNLAVVTLKLESSGASEERSRPRILLAPPAALASLGLVVAPGDSIRARVFRTREGDAMAHTLRVVNRDSWVRLRTLRRRPLWTADGSWLGGPLRRGRGRGRGDGRGCGR